MNKYDYKKIAPFKWFILENFPLIDEDFDALTNWQLFCKLGKEINKIINSQNNVGEQMENVTDAFIALQDYVNNYFENLDVQDEINNKLDEMAESGELEEIISAYLNLRIMFCYDTIADMKTAENLVAGSYAQTIGANAPNDGGGAKYLIREVINTDVVDDAYLIALHDNNLVAELIVENTFNIMTFYNLSEEVTSDGATYRVWNDAFEKAFTKICGKANITVPEGTFYLNDTLTLPYNATIEGVNQDTSVLKLIPYANCDMFHIGTEGYRDSGKLMNLTLQGDFIQSYTNIHETKSTTGNGIVFMQNTMDSDGNAVQNCYIRNFAENGILVNSGVWVILVENCQICFNRYNGIYNKGTDNFFNNLRVYFNGLSGIKSLLAGANKFSNIKLYYNCAIDDLSTENDEYNATLKHQNAGLIERGCLRNEYHNIEIQDNYYTGASFYTTNGVIFEGTFDDNGFTGISTQSLSDELYLGGCVNLNINAMFARDDLGYVNHIIETINTTDSLVLYTRAMEGEGDPNVSGDLYYKTGSQTNLVLSAPFNNLCGRVYTKSLTLTIPATSQNVTDQTVALDFTPGGKVIAFVNLYTTYNVQVFANISGSNAYIHGRSSAAISQTDTTTLYGTLVLIDIK